MTFQFSAATTAASAPTTSFTFGSQQNQPTTSATGFTFANQAAPSTSGLSFGNQANQPASAATGFAFGSQPNQPATSTTGFSLGGLTTQPVSNATNSGFTLTNAQNQPTTSIPASGFTFGSNQPPSTSTNLLQQGMNPLNAAKPTSTLSIGGSLTTLSLPTTASTLSATGGTALNAPTTITTSSLPGLGTTASTGFGLGTSNSLAGLGNQIAGTTGANLNLTTNNTNVAVSKPATSDPSFLVMGGTGLNKQNSSGTSSGSSVKDVKDSYLLDEVSPIVNAYTQEVKKQKKFRDEINQMSLEAIEKTREEISRLNQIAGRLSNATQRDSTVIGKLSAATQQELRNTEIIQKCIDGPSNYQNQETNAYFMRMLQHFEESMNLFQGQIEEIESLLASTNQNSDSTYAPDYFKDMHDVMISLAVQLQDIHSVVKSQREQYIKYRRIYFKEKHPERIFEDKKKKQRYLDKPKIGSNHNHTEILRSAGENPYLASRIANGKAATNVGYLNNVVFNMANSQLAALAGLGNVNNLGTTANQANLFTNFGNNFNAAGIQPAGSTSANNALSFGNQQPLGNTLSLGSNPVPQQNVTVNSSGLLFGGNVAGTGIASAPFQLQNPPLGRKSRKK
ncbi:Nucleoporin p58/p45 [Trichoplax sp. H2]|nr:Nucleoporin p58/p45 [Trichoplax sp. H2]|eukprot:RDD41419.1 Nucleoporin p58/p45 [Trichoplax sp. H2]